MYMVEITPLPLLLDTQTHTANTQHSTLKYTQPTSLWYTSVPPYWYVRTYTPHPHQSLYIFLHQGETGPHAAFLLQQPQVGLWLLKHWMQPAMIEETFKCIGSMGLDGNPYIVQRWGYKLMRWWWGHIHRIITVYSGANPWSITMYVLLERLSHHTRKVLFVQGGWVPFIRQCGMHTQCEDWRCQDIA